MFNVKRIQTKVSPTKWYEKLLNWVTVKSLLLGLKQKKIYQNQWAVLRTHQFTLVY